MTEPTQPESVLSRWNDPHTLLVEIASRNMVHLGPSDTLISAARQIARLGISSLLILDSTGRPLGIVTEYDLLRALFRSLPTETPLAEVMSSPVITVPDTITCRDAYQLCLEKGIRHLVIADPQGRAMAVVSETDFRLHLDLDTLAGQTSVATAMNRVVGTLPPDEQLRTALSLMACKSGSAIVITVDHAPVGILTERDVARLCLRQAELLETRLSDIMSAPVRTVTAETPLTVAAEHMLASRVRQLPVVDETGRLIGILNTRGLTRILAVKLIDSSLTQEQERSFNLLEKAPFPIVISRLRDGHIRYCNPWAARQLGVNRDTLLGIPISRFYRTPSDREALVTLVSTQGSVTDLELPLLGSNGELFDAIVSSAMIQFENEPALLTTLYDITQRKQAEEALQQERTRFQTVFRAIPDLVWLKDPEGIFLVCNRTFEKLYGASQSAIIGKSDYDFVDRDLAEFLRANDQKAMAAGGPVVNEEWLYFAEGGYKGLFETIKTPVTDANGAIIGVLGIARDISERRRTERDLRERIKEQQCLYAIAALTENIEQPWAEQLQEIVDRVGPGWQYPEITAVRLECADLRVTTPGFRETPWLQIAETTSKLGERVCLTVVYLEERPEEDAGPFFNEESRLAEAIVRRLADAMDRRRSAELVRERDQVIATMFAQTTDAILLVNQQTGRFVEFNEVAHQGLGYSREEFARLTVKDIQAEHSFEQIAANSVDAAEGKPIHFETRHRHKDGTLRDVALTLRPIKLNEQQLLSAVWQDITDRKAQERAIKDQAERLRLQNWLLGKFAVDHCALEGDLPGVAREVTALLGETLKIGRVSVWLTDEKNELPVCLDQYDSATTSHAWQHCLDGETVHCLARPLVTTRSLDIGNVRMDSRSRECFDAKLAPLGITSLLYCSIVSSGRQRGFLCLEQVQRLHHWQPDEITFGCQVADHLGMVLLNRERLDAVRQLQESEKRLQGITDSALDAILMINPDGGISYWNPAAEKILGYQAEEALGQDLHRLLAPTRYRPEYLDAFRDFQRSGRGKAVGRTLELTALRKDGQEITVALSMSAVRLDGSWHAVGIVRDISELKRNQAELQSSLEATKQANEEKNEILAHLEELVSLRTEELNTANERLRISEERYTLALEAAADGLWDWNIQDGGAYFSPAYCRMLGYGPDELPKDAQGHWIDLIHPEDREWVVTTTRQSLEEAGGYEIEFRMRTKAGPYIWILSRGKVVARDADNRPVRAVGTHTDLTARKQIELELWTANEEQRAILEAAATGISVIKNRQILRCNRQLERFFGYGPGEFIGQTTRCWYTSDAEFQEEGQEVARQLRERGKHHIERQLVRKDGSRFWARMTAQALDPQDLAKGLVGMVEDITREKEASEALLHAKETAEAATRAKSEFLANMSHEIRTPMNAIIGFAHLLRRDPLTPRQSGQLAKLTDASRHLLRVINDILDISKIEASKMTLEVEDFEPARVIDHVCGIIADRIAEKQLRLHVDLDHIPLMLRGDGARLGQVLLNLVGNAVKFTEQGRVDIIGRIVSENEAQVRVRFEVRDTGIGMTEEQLQRTFVAFEQADSSTTRHFGGTGLGLAISNRLVDLMGGTIGTESTFGQGSVFWIELPLSRSTQSPVQRLPVESLRHMRTLVIDDKEDSREIVAGMLMELGMRVGAAASGESGLEAVVEADQGGHPYRLLIIDWQLPGISGIETAARLQTLDLSIRPTFLIMTAYGDQLPCEQAAAAGIHRVMAKPVTPSILHDTLTEIIQPSLRYEQPESAVAQELAKRRGSHILLVEDNPINQEVAQMLLQSMGMEVSLADNGKTAVDMVSAAPFDLVCMDIHMPVMDGLQATRAIRQLPDGGSIPIVAMTANAFSEDREQCLRAGMNEHIAKPIEQETLERQLIKWLPVRDQAERPEAYPSSGQQEAATLLARLQVIAGLDAKDGLKRLLGDEERYLRLLGRFIEDHGRDSVHLARLAQSGETDALREKAHALKGTAATLGAARIQQEAAALEAMCKTGQTRGAINRQIGMIHHTLVAFTTALQELLPAPSPVQRDATFAMDRHKLVETLAALAELLRIGDTAATDLFEQAKPQLYAAWGPLAEQLDKQIRAFDYLDGHKTIQHMLKRIAA